MEKQIQITSPRIPTIPMEQLDDGDEFFLMDVPGEGRTDDRPERPQAGTAGRKSRIKKTFGTLQPPLSGSQSSLDLSTDSETDLFVDKEEPELMHSEDESLALELSALDRRAPSGRKTSSKMPEPNSDDDF